MMSVDNYLNRVSYEVFIGRAFKMNPRDTRFGSWNGDFTKVLKKVEAAFKRYLSRGFDMEDYYKLKELKNRLPNVHTKDQLAELIREANIMMKRYD